MQEHVRTGGAGRCLLTLTRCRHCRRAHVVPDSAVLVWCDGVLDHRPRWLIVDVEPALVAVAA